MQNNYYLIRQLTKELEPDLIGARVLSCFSQNRDELIIHFETLKKNDFFIRAHLRSDFSSLSFPAEFSRARKNTVDLFGELIHQKVVDIRQYINERAFSIELEQNITLLFKLHGNRSNIILFQPNLPPNIFKKELINDSLINLETIDRPLEQSLNNFTQSSNNIAAIFPTFNKEMIAFISSQIENEPADNAWAIIEEFVTLITNKPAFYVAKSSSSEIKLTLIKSELAEFSSHSAIEALNYFYNQKIRSSALDIKKRAIARDINHQIKRTKAYLKKVSERRNHLINDVSLQQFGDILMANLHVDTKNSNQVILFNFYTNENVSVKINPRLSLQKNAENYYRKSKNLKIEIQTIDVNIKQKQNLLIKLNKDLSDANSASGLKDFDKKHMANKKSISDAPKFKTVNLGGYQVLVGKNAKQNDELTLKHAKPNDLWLHAKDVTGSHVIIKNRPGQNYPKDVIERAAQIAAYYSKRKTDSLCPVSYTPKKYVRKRKGLPAGAVIVEKENVILVEPKNVSDS